MLVRLVRRRWTPSVRTLLELANSEHSIDRSLILEYVGACYT